MQNSLMSAKDTVVDFLVRYGFQIVGAVIILAAGVMAARWLAKVTENWLLRQKIELPVRTLAVRVVKLLVMALAMVLALDKFGVQIAPLIAGIGVAGAGIALAMQGMLSNVIAGLTIIFTKPFRVGEYIEILGEQGQVLNIELFSTRLMHADRSQVIIPNRKIIGEILHNYGSIRMATMTVAVAYDSDVQRVFATIHEVLAANARVLKEPAPGAGIASLGDSAINISIGFWVALADYGGVQPEIYRDIITRFRERGIEMPFPQRDVRVMNTPAGANAA
jgi:small conductance mechanosensitive channel